MYKVKQGDVIVVQHYILDSLVRGGIFEEEIFDQSCE